MAEKNKYQIIYADPPWEYANPKDNDPKMGGATYPAMSIESIKSLPIGEIADDNCALVLWCTMPKLKEGLGVIESWGFRYVTCLFTWVKLNPNGQGIYSGLGHWTNGNAELCLFGKRGRPSRMVKNVKQIQMWPRGRHSVKPPQIRDEIVRLFGDLPRIELFARQSVDGWDAMGNGIDGKDISVALQDIINGRPKKSI